MQAGQNRRAESPAGKEESAVSDLTIIGGADGPTAIFVSGPVAFPGWWPLGFV